jgi:hypothetical protein
MMGKDNNSKNAISRQKNVKNYRQGNGVNDDGVADDERDNGDGYDNGNAQSGDLGYKLNNQISSEEMQQRVDIFNIIKLVLTLCALIFSVLLLYILFSGNTSAVQKACGGMWELLLVRVIFSMVIGFIFGMDSWFKCHLLTFLREGWGAIFFLVYFMVFAISQVIIIPQAMIGNSTCVDTLSNNSPTGTPLLGVLGWINLAIDWCFAILMGISIVISKCSTDSDYNGNRVNDRYYYDSSP